MKGSVLETGQFLVLTTLGCNGIFPTAWPANYEWSIPVRLIIHLRLKLRRDKCAESRGLAGFFDNSPEALALGIVAASVKSPVRDERSLRTATTCGRPPIFLPSLAGLLPLMDA